ncbi:hypothetical protein D4764_06G0003560 [Takifugu flavidus]|uniref:Uncharacterized protein n=1 Tax=Takifugu flavidus TaxID=433684 RepID=A0A5C6MUS2_9TELE|nr:hypothetical protein D4764_06G0003560 [Takifugu flavidus]
MKSLIPPPPTSSSALKAMLTASHRIPSRECGCYSIDGAVSLLLPGLQRSDRAPSFYSDPPSLNSLGALMRFS